MTRLEFAPQREIESSWPKTLYLASPRGFCAGVERIVEFARKAKPRNGYHEIVHNNGIVRELSEYTGFVDEISSIPRGEEVLYSAHGVSPEVEKEAERLNLKPIDGTCPLVTKVHIEAMRFAQMGYTIILIAHRGHDEAVGTYGVAPEQTIIVENLDEALKLEVENPDKVAFLTQTTLSQDETAKIRAALKERFPKIVEPKKEDICYATQNRQDAVKETGRQLAKLRCKVVFVVVGSPGSSNSNRLREVAQASFDSLGVPGFAIMVDNVDELEGREDLFVGAQAVGLTSGASVPEEAFQKVAGWFSVRGSNNIENVIVADESKIHFAPIKF